MFIPRAFHMMADRLRRYALEDALNLNAGEVKDDVHERLLNGHALVMFSIGRHIEKAENEVLHVVNGRLPYEAFDAVEAEALQLGRTAYANEAHHCSDWLRRAAGYTLVELANRGDERADLIRAHEGLCAATLLGIERLKSYNDWAAGLMKGQESSRIVKELVQELRRYATLLAREPRCILSPEDIVQSLEKALKRRWIAFPSYDDFDALERELAAHPSPRANVLRNACAQCIALIEQVSVPRAMAVMQAMHARLGADSGLRALDAELVRRMILLYDH